MHPQTYCYSCKYNSHNFPPAKCSSAAAAAADHLMHRMVTASAVVIFSRSTCCMCHAVKRLFSGMGANPTVYELDQYHPRLGKELEMALLRLIGGGGAAVVPVVFVGGKMVGGMDRVLGSHIDGSLVPLLKEAGALWL